jgi:translation elongation factor EF-Ts
MTEPSVDPKTAAQQLRAALGDAFSYFECRKALASADGDFVKAAEWLTSGDWMTAKLISWDWESLHAKTAMLVEETGKSADECLQELKNCCGNIVLARRKLAGLPVLTA